MGPIAALSLAFATIAAYDAVFDAVYAKITGADKTARDSDTPTEQPNDEDHQHQSDH